MNVHLYTIRIICALAVTCICMEEDLRKNRVPNALTAVGVGLFFFLRIAGEGIQALPDLLAGLVLPLLFPGTLFLLGMLGGGDVKVLMMLGAFAGWRGILRMIAAGFLFGSLQAVVLVLARGNARDRFGHLKRYLKKCAAGRRLYRYDEEISASELAAGQMHFTVSILAALLWYLWR